MEQNKLELKDCMLTLEQAKELNMLGIDMKDSLYIYGEDKTGDREPLCLTLRSDIISALSDIEMAFDLTCTLPDTEIIRMLPKEIDNYQLKIVPFNEGYCVKYELYTEHSIYVTKDGSTLDFCRPILRDALFEMIRCLKINKLI